MNSKTFRTGTVSLEQQIFRLAPGARTIQEALATTDVAKFFTKTSAAAFDEGMGEVPSAWADFFQETTSSNRREVTRQNSPGENLDLVPEHGEIPFGKIIQPTIGFITNHKYANLFDVTEEMILYNETQYILDSMRELGERAANTMEQTAMAVLEDPDNFLTDLKGTTALSIPAIKAAIIAIRSQAAANGKRLGFSPDVLVVPPELEFEATEFIKSELLIIAGNTDVVKGNKNSLANRLRVIVAPQLSDSNNWYVGRAKRGLRMQVVQAPYLKDVTPLTASNSETTPTVDLRRQKAGAIFGAGMADNRHWFASFVSGS